MSIVSFNRVLSACILPIFIGLSLGSSGNAAELSTKIPTSLADKPAAFWQQAMLEFYGPYNKNLKCWIGKNKDRNHCMRPIKIEAVTENGRKLRYIIMGGSTLGEDGTPEQCHACAGSVGFVALGMNDETFSIVAKSNLYEVLGGWGEAPEEDAFELREIGPQQNLGWVIEGGWSGMGHTFKWLDIYGISAGTFYNLGSIPTGSNDDGNCENGKNLMSDRPCTDYSFELRFLERGNTSFYPILLDATGHKEGVDLEATHRIDFDEPTFRYIVPEELQEN